MSVGELSARIRRYNADLDPASDTFKAAILLLTAYYAGHNVELLARRTNCSRAFVSKCARRLIDNGVWSAGQTIADWSPDDEASGGFWNDVAVALGKLCRRSDEHGSIEWAPAGYWNKRYDFVTPEDSPVSTTYHNPAADAPRDDLVEDASDDADAEPASGESSGEVAESALEPVGSNGNGRVRTNGGQSGNGKSTDQRNGTRGPAPAHVPADVDADGDVPGDDPTNLFPGAVWLG